MNEMMVHPDITRVADVRCKTFVVDAPNTAYALIGRKIFKNAGLVDGQDYKLNPLGGTGARTESFETPAGPATMLNPPWSFVAKERGATSLGRTIDLFGPYQASGVDVMRPWAAANGGALERFLGAYIDGCRATLNSANRAQVLDVLQKNFKLDKAKAELTYEALTTPGHGLNKDCAMNMEGFKNVLTLRAEMEGQWSGVAPSPDKFLDLSFYQRALHHAER